MLGLTEMEIESEVGFGKLGEIARGGGPLVPRGCAGPDSRSESVRLCSAKPSNSLVYGT
jgi:hypothetical protein